MYFECIQAKREYWKIGFSESYQRLTEQKSIQLFSYENKAFETALASLRNTLINEEVMTEVNTPLNKSLLNWYL